MNRHMLIERLQALFTAEGFQPEIVEQAGNEEAVPLDKIVVRLEEERAVLFLLDSRFPATPPIVIKQQNKIAVQVDIPWEDQLPLADRLQAAVATVLSTDEPAAAADPDIIGRQVEDGIFARTAGVLSKAVTAKRVLVIGTGSVGSYVSEQLVRGGLKKLILIDPDVVEFSNLSRTVYNVHDVTKPKVTALAAHLAAINPAVELECHPKSIDAFEADELAALVAASDVVVAATDDPQAQRIINRFAYAEGKPAVFIGLYEGADGGEVILSVPEQTPCYQCSTAARHNLEQSAGTVGVKTDYGTGKLEGVIALAADIHHVTSAAVKLIFSFLIPEQSNVTLKGFAAAAIEKNFTYLTFAMKDNYWFYPHIFQNVAGQYAYQSVWLTPDKNEECPVCGKQEYRSSLAQAPVATPTLAEIRKALD